MGGSKILSRVNSFTTSKVLITSTSWMKIMVEILTEMVFGVLCVFVGVFLGGCCVLVFLFFFKYKKILDFLLW